MAKVQDFELPDEHLAAIGAVVIESAQLESTLRFLLNELTGASDAVWLLWEGNSTSWLITAAQTVARELREFSDRKSEWPQRLKTTLGRVKHLAELRNHVVHGRWIAHDEKLNDVERSCIQARPWGGSATEAGVWLCERSRRFKDATSQRWSTADVDRLADEIASAHAELWAILMERAGIVADGGGESSTSRTLP